MNGAEWQNDESELVRERLDKEGSEERRRGKRTVGLEFFGRLASAWRIDHGR